MVWLKYWLRRDQVLKPWFDRAHEAGAKVTHMVSSVEDAKRAADAGADVIIAQGTEGGGHVSWIATMTLIRTASAGAGGRSAQTRLHGDAGYIDSIGDELCGGCRHPRLWSNEPGT